MPTYEYPVNLTWQGPGSPGVNVWHFRADSPTGAEAQDCVDVIQGFYQDVVLAGVLPDAYSMVGGDEAVNVADNSIVPVTPWTENNASGGFPFAGPLMMVLTMATSNASRSGRGRKFIGPVGVPTISTDGTPTSGAVTGLENAGIALVAASQGLTLAAIGVYSPTDQLFRDLVSTRVRDTFAVLRSRRD